ncbi:YtxH domain-containing protein [Streptococcus saliviloxodontae]|uniref:Gas vesicle protein n=1 Tax=Streptococcus saliviloxodontae TaxID=1349416 RepID=A0ABS2PNJ2_9STRE|nr:YtxH domain-containing protein [Streptococcus saliviloxodontae]MBM7636373.1 gas vesicle protein [Streptococcus saliviloxodontae]
MNKFLKTVIVSATTGAAAAYFFTTKKGKEVAEKATDLYKDYKQDPESYHQLAKEKVNEYKEVAVDTFNDYKEKYENADFSKEDLLAAVKEKSGQVKDFATETLQSVKDVTEDTKEEVSAQVDDIVIDLVEDQPSSDTDKTQADA